MPSTTQALMTCSEGQGYSFYVVLHYLVGGGNTRYMCTAELVGSPANPAHGLEDVAWIAREISPKSQVTMKRAESKQTYEEKKAGKGLACGKIGRCRFGGR